LKDVAMLHDNARPHTVAHITENLHQLKSEVLKHPLYTPDLASVYNMFCPLKDTLRGHHFTSDHEVQEVVHAWLVTQLQIFLSEAI
jgi:hypothetical protein